MAVENAKQQIPRVPETIDFSAEEEKIIKFWKEKDVFRTCLKQSKGKPRCVLKENISK